MSKLIVPTDDEMPIFVGGILGALGTPERVLSDVQRSVIDAILAAAGTDLRVADAVPLDPSDVRAGIGDPDLLAELGHFVIALELMAHPLEPRTERHARKYLEELGIEDRHMRISRDSVRKHRLLLHADLLRQSWTTEQTIRGIFTEDKLKEFTRSKLSYYGFTSAPTVAERWKALQRCPDGSWGRTVADFYVVHGFPFPGEPHGIYEVGAAHDWVHVLCDYATTPEGEIDVFAYIAVASPDPAAFVNFALTLALFQNATINTVGGKKVVIARADTLSDEGAAPRFADALARGNEATADVIGLDHFALKDLPLDEARERFGIVPKSVPGPGWDQIQSPPTSNWG